MEFVLSRGDAERRADLRYKVSFRVHWGREESPDVEGQVTDLSAGGCFVLSAGVVNKGDLVKLQIEMPGRGDLMIWGNVTHWVRDAGFGVRFTTGFRAGG